MGKRQVNCRDAWREQVAYAAELVLLDDRSRLEPCRLDREEKERLERNLGGGTTFKVSRERTS